MVCKKYIFLVPFIAFLAACYHPKEFKNIGIFNWSEGLVGYQQALKGILDGLHDNGYREGINIKIDYKSAQGKDAEARRILDEFVRKKYDLIVTIGSAACLIAADATKDSKIPVVYSVVSYPKEAGIIKDWQSSGNNITGVSIEIPAELYLEKLKKIIPDAKDLGIVYTGKHLTAIAAAKQAEITATKFDLIPHLMKLEEEDAGENMRRLIKSQTKLDAIYVVADPILYSEKMMATILPVIKKSKIPSLLISENYLKYGALFALNGDFYKIGRQTVPHILKIFDGIAPENIPNEKPYDIRFTINKKTADDLNIDLSWNVIIEADSIVE